MSRKMFGNLLNGITNGERGDVEAQLEVAIMYHDGDGTERDYKEAMKSLKKAAEKETMRLSSALATCTNKDRVWSPIQMKLRTGTRWQNSTDR